MLLKAFCINEQKAIKVSGAWKSVGSGTWEFAHNKRENRIKVYFTGKNSFYFYSGGWGCPKTPTLDILNVQSTSNRLQELPVFNQIVIGQCQQK